MKIGLEIVSCSDAENLSDLIQAEGYFFGLCPIMKMSTDLIVSPGDDMSLMPASLPLKHLILSSAGTFLSSIYISSKFNIIDGIPRFE